MLPCVLVSGIKWTYAEQYFRLEYRYVARDNYRDSRSCFKRASHCDKLRAARLNGSKRYTRIATLQAYHGVFRVRGPRFGVR